MEEILKTTLLESEKSAFLIDIVQHHNGKQYIRIHQTITDEENECKRSIKINPSLLSDLVSVLVAYQELIPSGDLKLNKITEYQKEVIRNNFLKGISVSDLALQFDCKAELIKQILTISEIEIEDNKLPLWLRSGRKKSRKRRN